MAQNTFISLTVPTGDIGNAVPSHGGSASGDITLSFDTSKITTYTKLRAAVAQLLRMAESNAALGR